MAHVIIMPRQGNTVESCILVEWKVKEGDAVTEETAVCSVETDKAAFEVPAGANGTVLKIIRAAGDDVPVLEPIAVIGAAGEDWSDALGTGIGDQGSGIRERDPNYQSITPEQDRSANNNPRYPIPDTRYPIFISPRAKNLAARKALPLEGVSGTGPGGRIIERDVAAALEGRPALTASAKAAAKAAAFAEGQGAIPAAGAGIGGRITLDDLSSPMPHRPDAFSVDGAFTGPLAVPPSSSTPYAPAMAHNSASSFLIPHSSVFPGKTTETPIKGIRKIIADRMHKSLAETAQFTLNASAPVSRLQDIRSRMKNSAADSGLSKITVNDSKITVNDLILFAVSRVLPRYSYMNAHKTGDTLITFEQVHLGFAVDTPRGLMVPVIRNANLLSLGQISSETKRLAKACQEGGVKPDEISGSTFTVTNLGSLGISSFTPVLNTPEVAILGVCSIELKPVMQSQIETAHRSSVPSPHRPEAFSVTGAFTGPLAVPPSSSTPYAPAMAHNPASPFPVIYEPHIGFSLTINHQVVDGAPAARFLRALGEAIANIDLLLMAG